MPKIKLEIVVAEAQAQGIIDAIIESAKTGEVGDGKIFITDLSSIVRIRTGEMDREAL